MDMLRLARRTPTNRSSTLALPMSASSSRGKNTCGLTPTSSVKKSASAIGIPSSTFFSELTEGLTRFCSIKEMSPLVTPARFANSRCDRPYICRMDFKWAPTSRLIVFSIIDKLTQIAPDIELNVDFPYHLHASPVTRKDSHERSALPCSPARATGCFLDAVHGEPPVQVQSAAPVPRLGHALLDGRRPRNSGWRRRSLVRECRPRAARNQRGGGPAADGNGLRTHVSNVPSPCRR